MPVITNTIARLAHLLLVQERTNVGKVVRQFNLSQKFVDMSYGIFRQLDLDQNGVIDQG